LIKYIYIYIYTKFILWSRWWIYRNEMYKYTIVRVTKCPSSKRHRFFFAFYCYYYFSKGWYCLEWCYRDIYSMKTININRLTPQSNLFIDISVSFFFLLRFFPSSSSFSVLSVDFHSLCKCWVHSCLSTTVLLFSFISMSVSSTEWFSAMHKFCLLSLLDICLRTTVTETNDLA